MTYVYKSKQEVNPLPARIPFQPTHKITRRDGSTFEVNTTPEFLAKWQERLGWTAEAIEQLHESITLDPEYTGVGRSIVTYAEDYEQWNHLDWYSPKV